MVTIQQTELKEGILKAIEKAKRFSASILVSEVHKIDSIDPLLFFSAGEEKYSGERFFWKHSSEAKYMIGIGICKQISSDQETDRFFHVEKEWKRFIDQAIILDDDHIEGTGPTAFGGFSFDPLKEKTVLWSKFSHSLFHIPMFMLSINNGQTFLTTNILCTDQDDLSIYMKVEKEREKLLKQASKQVEFNRVSLTESIDVHPKEWKRSVTRVVNEIKRGTLKKVVLARELRLLFDKKIQTESVLNRLLREQLDSYVFAFESNGDCFIGATPERLLKKTADQVYSTCLAGSIARGENEMEDEQLGNSLLNDNKNLIEHQYVVDMIKAAMEDTCSEVVIPKYPRLLKLKHIQHLYTPVKGVVNHESSLLSLVERLHPTPALGGLPEEASVAKIREVENLDRGFYAGPLGWFDHQGNGEFAVAIRSGLIQGNEASLFAGCGVVKDSISDLEFEETKIKFKPMLSALGGLES
ncbi:isochorismate synthase [Bacillus sp. V3B]|uniref:isochorismate synthase n=1 Tax=Bacillus sp. V3B TaxID=2804915 RepID=UPI00210C04F1|nr:isochorismate synthase [Bacillus sp. V3B]MCQ6274479.1 isochorismate synthase [Bacillus sp. V3B]